MADLSDLWKVGCHLRWSLWTSNPFHEIIAEIKDVRGKATKTFGRRIFKGSTIKFHSFIFYSTTDWPCSMRLHKHGVAARTGQSSTEFPLGELLKHINMYQPLTKAQITVHTAGTNSYVRTYGQRFKYWQLPFKYACKYYVVSKKPRWLQWLHSCQIGDLFVGGC